MPLTHKVALITGGAQGIGKGIAEYLLTQGMQVVIADIDESAAQNTVAELESLGTIRFITTDVTKEHAVQYAITWTLETLGQLDGLVNNAAIANPDNGHVEDLSLTQWQWIIETNLTAYFLFAKYAIPHLRRQRGAIVNIASTRALQSEAHTEAYAASKGGVIALTHALAISLGPEIRVNAISPGWIDVNALSQDNIQPIDHEKHPVGRVGQPIDIATAVAFLLDAPFISGENIIVDGGMSRKMIY